MEERFKVISHAYDVLSDPEKKSHYDTLRSGGKSTGNTSGFQSQDHGE
jgi:DnaJ-class molecular chaperone